MTILLESPPEALLFGRRVFALSFIVLW